jgi:hypothetical protein
MKKLLFILLIIVLIPVIILGYLGFITPISSILGTNKPRDLGIKYTQEDLTSIRNKNQVKYETLPQTTNPSQTRGFQGQKQVNSDYTSKEITATMNNQPWKYWPYKDVQVKFNADGSGEISGILMKEKFPEYASIIGIPSEATNFAMKFLPPDPVFYVKLKGSLVENKVSEFEPVAFEIGRVPMPLNVFLSLGGTNIIKPALAQNINEMTNELSKVQNKKALIIDFINTKLSSDFGSFYAKKAYFGENKVFFEGTLPEKISYTP